MNETPDSKQSHSSKQKLSTPSQGEEQTKAEVEASLSLKEIEWEEGQGEPGHISEKDEIAAKRGPRFLRETIYEKLIKPIFNMDDTPESIALGAAIGMFIAITPTVGIQMPVTVTIGTFINRYTRFQMNNIIGAAMCWVSNPVTFVPMYYIHTWLGWVLMGRDTSELLSLASWQVKITSYVPPAANPSAWDYVKGFFLAGVGELLVPMWIGALIFATIISIPTYPVTLRAVRKFQQRKKRNA